MIVKPAEKTSIVMEQFLRMLHHCGMPHNDCDLLNGSGATMEGLLTKPDLVQLTQFTGSSHVGEKLALVTKGKVKLEDAGFDWKVGG